jgi:hypothetical protein
MVKANTNARELPGPKIINLSLETSLKSQLVAISASQMLEI